jgi:hypothetical protein
MTDTLADLRIRIRHYGTPDPRLAKALTRENDPGLSPHGRAKAVGEVAREAGWPAAGWIRSREQATAAMQRLEGGDFTLRTHQRRFHQRAAGGYESRRWVTNDRGVNVPVEDPDTGGYARDDGPATIFDE